MKSLSAPSRKCCEIPSPNPTPQQARTNHNSTIKSIIFFTLVYRISNKLNQLTYPVTTREFSYEIVILQCNFTALETHSWWRQYLVGKGVINQSQEISLSLPASLSLPLSPEVCPKACRILRAASQAADCTWMREHSI